MLSPKQRKVLAAVCESILPPPSSGSDTLESLNPTIERVEKLIASLPDPGDRARLLALLAALDSRTVNLVTSGRFGAISNMDISARQAALKTWAHSRFGMRRAGFQALKRLANVSYYCWPDADGSHAAWRTADYLGPLPFPERPVEPLTTISIDRNSTMDCDVVVVGSGAGGIAAQGSRSWRSLTTSPGR